MTLPRVTQLYELETHLEAVLPVEFLHAPKNTRQALVRARLCSSSCPLTPLSRSTSCFCADRARSDQACPSKSRQVGSSSPASRIGTTPFDPESFIPSFLCELARGGRKVGDQDAEAHTRVRTRDKRTGDHPRRISGNAVLVSRYVNSL